MEECNEQQMLEAMKKYRELYGDKTPITTDELDKLIREEKDKNVK